MSCCGGNRGIRPSQPLGASPVPPARTGPATGTLAIFRYDGAQSMTVYGRGTGRKYWFSGNGAEVAVDIRDRDSLRQVPRLTMVRLA